MPFPKITYDAGAGTVTLNFALGPQNFSPIMRVRAHDNLATSGAVRERVVEATDILLPFGMAHLLVGTTVATWAAFLAWGLSGGEFKFYPDGAQGTYYNCVLEEQEIAFARNAPKKYGTTVTLRVLLDGSAPTDIAAVLTKFYGG